MKEVDRGGGGGGGSLVSIRMAVFEMLRVAIMLIAVGNDIIITISLTCWYYDGSI